MDLSGFPLGVRSLEASYRRRELSPVEVVRFLCLRAEKLNPILNALTTTSFDDAVTAATESERRFRLGEPRPLEGVPVVVKDLIDTAGVRTTYGSKIFASHVPGRDAPTVRCLREAGALLIGKAATHEFAWGVTTDNEHFGPTRNPWSVDRVPGGSSGGSAAAVAAGLASLAVGTDTAGSVRIPAGCCGVVGFRPTFGTIDTAGVFGLAPSFDTVGPLGSTVDDVRALYLALRPTSESAGRAASHDGLRVGVIPALDQVPLSPAALTARDAAAGALEGAGATVCVIDAPEAPDAFDTLVTLVMAEGGRTHREAGLWPGRRAEYGREVRARLDAADRLDPNAEPRARQARLDVIDALNLAFSKVDLLLSVATPVAPPPIDVTTDAERVASSEFRRAVISANAPQSLAGLPACVVRGGFDDDGLPVGVQLAGPMGADQLVLEAADALFLATEVVQARRPALPH